MASAYDLLGGADERKRFDEGEIDATGAERPPYPDCRDYAASEHAHRYADDSGFADYMDAEDVFAELLRRSARERANRRGADLRCRLPIAFVDTITGENKCLTLPEGGTLDVRIPLRWSTGRCCAYVTRADPAPAPGLQAMR